MTDYIDHESQNNLHEDDGLAIGNDAPGRRHGRPSAQGLRSTQMFHEPEEASVDTNAVGCFHGPTTHQEHGHRQNVDPDSNPSRRQRVPLKRMCSRLDWKTTIRFTVVGFSYSLGFATAYSVYVAANRSDEALPSLRSDIYPVMVAQVAGSLLSPLLFGVVSIRNGSIPLRQQMTSFYYILLALGVLMSVVSLLLYSLWPAGYRVNNVVTIASLMFAILGGWQSLEKDWKEAAETHQVAGDIELGDRQS